MKISSRPHYFDEPLSRGFLSLYTAKAIVIIASGLVGIFLPLFLYNLFGGNLIYVIIYYAIGYFLYGITVALGAQFLNTFGFRKALRASVFIGAIFYLTFFFMDEKTAAYLLPISIIILLIYRSLYWIPYHVDFAKFTNSKNRGRQYSAMRATFLMVATIVPVIAGFIINRYSFEVLFFFAIILFLISGIPYITIPHTKERFSWGYIETWKKFFSHIRSKVLIAYMADGAENVVGLIVWPIFIFQILKGNYLYVGAISTLITAFAVVLQLTLGKYIDTKIKKESVLKWGSIFYSAGWIIKIFIATAFQIFLAGAYHNLAKIFTRTPFDTISYDISADEGHYIDEFTVLREIALHIGKVIMSILIIIVALFFQIQLVFILSAAAALIISLIRARDLDLTKSPLPNILNVRK